jgi:hypothetical protein
MASQISSSPSVKWSSLDLHGSNIQPDQDRDASSFNTAEASSYSFLFDRLRTITVSLGKNYTFTLEQLIFDQAVRQNAARRMQTLLEKKIKKISKSILEEIANAAGNINIESAKRNIADINQWHFVLRLAKDVTGGFGYTSERLKNFETLLALVAKVTNFFNKLKNGDLTINLKELINRYSSVTDMLEGFYDIITTFKDTVQVLDKNTFIKMAYEALGYGNAFTPFTTDFMEILSYSQLGLIPISFYLKGVAFNKSHIEWLNFDERKTKKTLSQVRLDLIKTSVDMAKETLKIGVGILIYCGTITAVPGSVTIILAIMGAGSLCIKIYKYNAGASCAEDVSLIESEFDLIESVTFQSEESSQPH